MEKTRVCMKPESSEMRFTCRGRCGPDISARGFSLVEVLVATVVFSVGVLGVAGLNAVSKRTSYEAVQRSVASELAYSLLEDMRANRRALPFYLALGTLGNASRGASAPSPACSNALVSCTADEIANFRIWEWERALDGALETVAGASAGGLVSPSACVTGPAGGGAGIYAVTVVWRGQSDLVEQGANNCGLGSGLYGAADEFRRYVSTQTYLHPLF